MPGCVPGAFLGISVFGIGFGVCPSGSRYTECFSSIWSSFVSRLLRLRYIWSKNKLTVFYTLARSICTAIVRLPPTTTQGIRVATESRQLLVWITGRVPNRRLETIFGCLWQWLDTHRIPLLLSRRIPGLGGQFDEILAAGANLPRRPRDVLRADPPGGQPRRP